MMMWDSLEWFLVNLAIFMPLAFLIPGRRKQPRLRRDMITDGLYCFCGPLVCAPAFRLIFAFLISLGAVKFIQRQGQLANLSLLAQVAIIVVLTDFLQYWAHRVFHRASLWKFHAIHHAARDVDWLTSVRFHPVNFILYSTAVNALVIALGFSGEAFTILLPFNVLYSPLVHANLDWTYGPLKYVLVSPVFHRWHHTHPGEGGDRNFAPVFSFWDVIFGTFYMPDGKIPEIFGTPHDAITGNIFQQLAYPFLPGPARREEVPVLLAEDMKKAGL
jgi:sterol desaturase/sphingolipid hydroxylase (fatty acid hydroxylase superfamily)